MKRQGGPYRKTRSKLAQELPEVTLDLNAKPTEVRLLFVPGHGKQCISGKDVGSEATKMLFAKVKSWLPTLFSCMQVSLKHPFVPQYSDVVTRASESGRSVFTVTATYRDSLLVLICKASISTRHVGQASQSLAVLGKENSTGGSSREKAGADAQRE